MTIPLIIIVAMKYRNPVVIISKFLENRVVKSSQYEISDNFGVIIC